MKNQAYRMSMLYDFYGDLLTDRQKEFFDLYYNDDLSLSEIAENYGISRQGVRDVIVRAEAAMEQLDKLRGCEVHSSVILSEVDEQVFKRLGANLTCEPRFKG